MVVTAEIFGNLVFVYVAPVLLPCGDLRQGRLLCALVSSSSSSTSLWGAFTKSMSLSRDIKNRENCQPRIHVLSHPGVAYCFPKWLKLEKQKNVVRIPNHEQSENLQRECQKRDKHALSPALFNAEWHIHIYTYILIVNDTVAWTLPPVEPETT